VLSVDGLICVHDASYTKHAHSIHMFSEVGTAYILRATDGIIQFLFATDINAMEWMDRINYTSAFTSCGIRPDIFPRDKTFADLQEPSPMTPGEIEQDGNPRALVIEMKVSQLNETLSELGKTLYAQNQSLEYVINLIAVNRFSKAKLQLEREKV
jgi:hypothetical protein